MTFGKRRGLETAANPYPMVGGRGPAGALKGPRGQAALEGPGTGGEPTAPAAAPGRLLPGGPGARDPSVYPALCGLLVALRDGRDTDADRFRLLFGPYKTPRFRYGKVVSCEFRPGRRRRPLACGCGKKQGPRG